MRQQSIEVQVQRVGLDQREGIAVSGARFRKKRRKPRVLFYRRNAQPALKHRQRNRAKAGAYLQNAPAWSDASRLGDEGDGVAVDQEVLA